MKNRYAWAHMRAAYEYADLSYCNRRKVGCVFVKNDNIISMGFNGTPPGWPNECEDESGKTKPEVYHAETNAIAKLAGSRESGTGASVFVTCAPCFICAKSLAQIGIKELYFSEEYNSTEGLDHLTKRGIPVYHLPITRKQQGEHTCSCQHWPVIHQIKKMMTSVLNFKR